MPFTTICEICTLELPVLVIVSLCVEDDPVFTLPKLAVVVLKESVSVAAMPVPLKPTTLGEPEALLTIEMLPLAEPVAEGSNCTLKVLDCPGLIESGKVRPLVLKPFPVTLAWVIVNVALPGLLIWMV